MAQEEKTLQWMVLESTKGDTQAFRFLYEECKDGLFAYIRRRVGTREDALDILQDTFTEVWKCFKDKGFAYSSDPEFMGFITTIARRRIARFYRFRMPTVSLEDLEIADEEREGISDILKAIEKLNSSDQELVRLHYFEGLPFKAIARLLESQENTIKVRHHRAIAKLKEILGYEKE